MKSNIWHKKYSIDDLNKRGENTLCDFLGIKFTKIANDSIEAIMPVTERTKQPIGIVHGGANVVLAETIASTAANMVIDIANFYCVGLEINANHLRAVREGSVRGVARAIHLGRTTQVWQIDLFNDLNQQTCTSRMSAAVIKRK